MKKKVLLVGSSYSAAPFFFALKKRNFHISVCGANKNDPCHNYADKSYFIDYSDKNLLLQLVSSEKFDYLIPSCNDFSYLSASYVATKLNIPGYDSYKKSLILHTKERFRLFTEAHKLLVPKSFRNISEHDFKEIQFPVLVKPVDSFSGRGVSYVDSEEKLRKAIEIAIASSREKHFQIEEYVDGSLHSHSAFIENGKFFWEGFTDEFCTVYPFQVDGSCFPSYLSKSIKTKISNEICKIVKSLSLVDGLLHSQILVKGNSFWIVECMRRCPGDLFGLKLEKATMLPFSDMYVKKFINEKYDKINLTRDDLYIRKVISSNATLETLGFDYEGEASNISVIPLKNSGKILKQAPFDKQAIVFMKFDRERFSKEKTINVLNGLRPTSLRSIYG